MIDLADLETTRVMNRDAPDNPEWRVEISYDALKKLIEAVRALRASPCELADFPSDTCEFWAEKYGIKRCTRCAALVDVVDTAKP